MSGDIRQSRRLEVPLRHTLICGKTLRAFSILLLLGHCPSDSSFRDVVVLDDQEAS